MKMHHSRAGFALVVTVLLLGLLMLVVYGLSALGRVGMEISASGTYQVQARQHALLGLGEAMARLEREAAGDDRCTGMAGITGISEGANQPARLWCGVWDRNGQFVRWLVSGASGPIVPSLNGPDSLVILGAGALGADGNDHEHIRVLSQPVIVNTRERAGVTLGRYAWWVGDEGVKLSAVLPDEKHGIDELITLPPDAPLLANTLTYEQIGLVPATVSSAVLAGQLRTNFHALGRTHLSLVGGVSLPGRLNVNTTSARYWRGVAATYNRLKPVTAAAIPAAAFGSWMRDHLPLADPAAGKSASAPYASVDLFLNGAALSGALGENSGLQQAFVEVMRPWLAVRSDTFRVRAYGESLNPAGGAVESVAWCEAILQRVKDDPAGSEGRFIITYFRWLGPEDI